MLGASAPVASAIGAGLGAAGSIAGGASAGRAKGRADEAQISSLLDSRRNQSTLDFAKFNQQASQGRGRQMLMADLLSGMGPSSDPRVQKAQFIDYNKAINPETIAAMRAGAQGHSTLQPQVTATPQAGKTDSFLNALSLGGTALGALSQLKKPAPVATMTDMPGATDLEDLIKQQRGYA